MLKKNPEAAPDTGRTAAKPFRVALCGEVRSGKSTLVNLLARTNILPASLGDDGPRPVIVVGHGPRRPMIAVRPDGTRDELPTGPDARAFAGAERIEVQHGNKTLAGFELIEIPLTRAEEITDEQRALLRGADVMIWVTIASQAWRLTEKTIVEALAEERPGRAIIAITRADKLRSDNDRQRIADRVMRETGGIFSACHMVSGARKLIEGSGNAKGWARTGGAGLQALLTGFRDAAADLEPRPEPEPAAAEVPEPEAAAAREPLAQPEPAEAPARTEPVAETEPEPEEAHLSGPELLRQVAATLRGLSAAGLADASGDCLVLDGEEAHCRAVAETCRASFRTLTEAYGYAGDGAVESAEIATARHRLLYAAIPESDRLVFLACEAPTSIGIAKSALNRLRDAAARF